MQKEQGGGDKQEEHGDVGQKEQGRDGRQEEQGREGKGDQDRGEGQRKNRKKRLFERQMQNTSQKVQNAIKDSKHHSTIVTIVTLSSCFTVYNFILDMLSVHKEETSDLPGYYEQNHGIYIYTIFFASVSLFFLIIGIVWFLVCCYLLGAMAQWLVAFVRMKYTSTLHCLYL